MRGRGDFGFQDPQKIYLEARNGTSHFKLGLSNPSRRNNGTRSRLNFDPDRKLGSWEGPGPKSVNLGRNILHRLTM